MADTTGGSVRKQDISPYREFSFPEQAKRFEIAGTSNYPGAAGLGGSLALLNEVGIKNVESHIRGLTDLLHDGLGELGARVISKRDPACRSGITVFRIQEDPAEDLRLLNAVLAE